jgi:hypothetical protein
MSFRLPVRVYRIKCRLRCKSRACIVRLARRLVLILVHCPETSGYAPVGDDRVVPERNARRQVATGAARQLHLEATN